MRALCWKELRENVKWALLAMAALGLGEMYALYGARAGGNSYNSGVTLCQDAFLTVTLFGSAAAGMLLGLLQVLPELRRDQWAALLHRPVPRGAIFLGKAAAGLLLYALATLPPFLLSVWLAATPGHFPSPFVQGMVLPGTADICAGVLYYFAALALALQRDKWIGLRAFPVLAAFHCSWFANWAGLFHVAIEAVALMALALFAAGWGTMVHQERFAARPWAARLGFLAMVFYGACGLGDLAMSILEAVGPATHFHRIEYMVTENGTPVRVTYGDNVCVSVTDPGGNPVAGNENQPSRIDSYFHQTYMNNVSSYIGDSHGWKEQAEYKYYRDSRQYLEPLSAYSYPKFEQWFYLVHERSLIGYLVPRKQAIARFDQQGMEPVSAEPRPFLPETIWENNGGDHLMFWDGKRLSFVSLPKRESVDLPLPGSGPVYGIGQAVARDSSGTASVFGVALPDRLAVYDDSRGTLVATLPYHQNMDRWGTLRLGLNGAMDHFFLWYQPSTWIDLKTRQSMPSYFEVMNSHGAVLKSWTLPPLPPASHNASLTDFLFERLQSPAFFFGGMAYEKIGALLGSERLRDALSRQVGQDRRVTEEIALYIIILSFALAAATLFWARRVYFSWPRAGAWAAFVLVFNLGGFITFRLAADWPGMAPCPRCRRPRPIHEDLCPNCAAGWPEAELAGTEVFDNAPAGAGV